VRAESRAMPDAAASLRMSERWALRRLERGDPNWPVQLALALIIVLQLTLADQVSVGPTWLAPAAEAVLLAALVVVSPARATKEPRGRRALAMALIAVVGAINLVSLGLLVHYLVQGGHAQGHALIFSGTKLLLTNVLLFAVWFWELDRGGPVARFSTPDALPDFLFPQMDDPQFAQKGWRPGFFDYLYTSLTNANAFSPTDTMPLTHTAKAIMAIESVSSLVTIGLVLARAVNILAS
jgi:hypothetical protein